MVTCIISWLHIAELSSTALCGKWVTQAFHRAMWGLSQTESSKQGCWRGGQDHQVGMRTSAWQPFLATQGRWGRLSTHWFRLNPVFAFREIWVLWGWRIITIQHIKSCLWLIHVVIPREAFNLLQLSSAQHIYSKKIKNWIGYRNNSGSGSLWG